MRWRKQVAMERHPSDRSPLIFHMASAHSIRWGILSTAEITGKVAPALQSAKGSSLVGIASRSLEKAEAWRDKHCPSAKAYGSYDELIASDGIDAVYIPLPSGLRNEWVLRCARAKKHVYVEKPFFGNVDELTRVCRENGVQFMDGTMWVHSTRSREIQGLLNEKKIGNVRRVTTAFSFKAPSQEWRDGGNGRTNKEREPFGCFGDQGWYCIGAILFGFSYEKPQKVQMTHVIRNKVDTIVTCSGLVFFDDERVASFDCGCELAHRSWFEVAGTNGIIRVDDQVGGDSRTGNFDAYFVPYVGSKQYILGDVNGKDELRQVEGCDHVISLVEDFAEATKDGKTDNTYGERTALQQCVMEALFKSAEEGCRVVELL